MKIFIDHFYAERTFAQNLSNRIKSLKFNIEVVSYDEIREKRNSFKLTKDEIKTSDIVIPIITSDYISAKETNDLREDFEEISESRNRYVLPIIYSFSQWSSLNWLVKSNVFPKSGEPISDLSEREQQKVINSLILTIENIIAQNSQVSNQRLPEVIAKKQNIVFISHSHDDADFAELLKLQLEKEGIDGWIDGERLKIGQDWRQEIDESINNSIAVIAIMSPEAKKSEYVTYEWAYAWGKGKQIFPLMLKQTPLHPRLESLQYLDFTNRVTRPWANLIASLKLISS